MCSLKRNGYGLCDMTGNVWEWVADGYSKRLPGGTDPLGVGFMKVFRGGSWHGGAPFNKINFRAKLWSSWPFNSLGFRLAISGPGQSTP